MLCRRVRTRPPLVRSGRIAEAGVARIELTVFSYVNAIREIAGRLYVCGSGGQVYMRVGVL